MRASIIYATATGFVASMSLTASAVAAPPAARASSSAVVTVGCRGAGLQPLTAAPSATLSPGAYTVCQHRIRDDRAAAVTHDLMTVPSGSAKPAAGSSIQPCTGALAGSRQFTAAAAAAATASSVLNHICIHRIDDAQSRAAARRLLTSDSPSRRHSTLAARPASAGSLPVATPSWCPPSATAVYHFDSACAIDSYELIIFRADNGQIAGTLDYNVIEYSYWERDLLDFINEVELDPFAYTGQGNVGWVSRPDRIYCQITSPGAGVSCAQSEYNFPDGASLSVPADYPASTNHIEGWASVETTFPSGTESLIGHQFSWELDYVGPLPIDGPSGAVANDAFVTYCDNNLPGITYGGCKAPTDRYTPVLTYHLSTYPTLAKAIQAAQAKGVPGAPSSGQWLLRATSGTINYNNRNTACPSSWTTPAGYQCDEYPAAATYEGASFNSAKGITFSFCQNSHLSQTTAGPKWESCFVPSGENSSEGGVRLQFWNANRTLDNDRFYIQIAP